MKLSDKTVTQRERYELHAAPEAIAAQLDENLRMMRRFENENRWLANLMRVRLRQVRNGEWPAVKGGNDE